jgi:hypothetical protein
MENMSCTGLLEDVRVYCREDFCSAVEDLHILQQRIYSAVEDIFCIGGFLQRIYISEEAIFCNGRYILQWRISAVVNIFCSRGYIFQRRIYSEVEDFGSGGYILQQRIYFAGERFLQWWIHFAVEDFCSG